METIKKLVIETVIPIVFVFVIFFFTKPSDDRCRKSTAEKLATENLGVPENEIYVKDVVFCKVIKHVSRGDTSNIGYGVLSMVRLRKSKLADIRSSNEGQHSTK